MKIEMENELKSFFQEKNQSHVKKSRQPNIPKIAGQCITEHGVADHVEKREEVKQLKLAKKQAKKRKTICKLIMPLPNPAEKTVTQNIEPITTLSQKKKSY